MCRIAAYFGPPMALCDLIDGPPHGLTGQSREAREMTGTNIAGDGWGIGWFDPEIGPRPGILKSILPLWADENARSACPVIRSGRVLGHVRYASPGIEVCFTNMPLYNLDDNLYTLNGQLQPWPGPLSKAIRDRLDPDHEADVRGATDAEMLGALWRTHFRRKADRAAALRSMLAEARELTFKHDGTIQTNVMLATPNELLAVRYGERAPANTLYMLSGEARWRGGTLVASEPFDDGAGWREVPPSTLVRVTERGVELEPLGIS